MSSLAYLVSESYSSLPLLLQEAVFRSSPWDEDIGTHRNPMPCQTLKTLVTDP